MKTSDPSINKSSTSDVSEKGFFNRFLRWQGSHIPENAVIIFLAALIGILTGTATFLLKSAIAWLGHIFTDDMNPATSNIRFLFIPFAGILLASIFQRYIIKENLAHGTALIRRHLVDGQYKLAPNLIYNSLLGCTMTIGFGGSAGAESPSAFSGAAIASNVGRLFKMSPSWMRLLLGIGAGAGIAGIFKAPLGGVMFALEVLGMELGTIPVLALVISCLFASGAAFAWSGFRFDVSILNPTSFDASLIPMALVLGVVCGIYSVYYNLTKVRMGSFFNSVSNPWARNIIAGASLGLLIFFLPSLFGEGYGVVSRIVSGDSHHLLEYSPFSSDASRETVLLIGVAAILLVKGMLVAATNSGGGVAGEFAPTLFAGCLAGFLFGSVSNHLFGTSLPVAHFSLIGMAAVMAGTVQAPLMAIFITAEMSDSLRFMPMFICAAGVSYAVAQFIGSFFGDAFSGGVSNIAKKDQEELPVIGPEETSEEVDKPLDL